MNSALQTSTNSCTSRERRPSSGTACGEPSAVSDNGKVIAGWGLGDIGYAGWVVKIDTAFICHQSNGTPGTGQKGTTMKVDFPTQFDQHLAHGDTVGRCRR